MMYIHHRFPDTVTQYKIFIKLLKHILPGDHTEIDIAFVERRLPFQYTEEVDLNEGVVVDQKSEQKYHGGHPVEQYIFPDRPAPQKENGHHSQCDAQEDRAVTQGKDSRQQKKGERLLGKTDVAEGQEKRDDYQSRHDIPHPNPEHLKEEAPLPK